MARRPAVDQALCARSRFAAHHADGVQLVDQLGHGHQARHRTKRFTTEVCVQTGDQHPPSGLRQLVDDGDEFVVEELGLVDGHHGDRRTNQGADHGRPLHRGGLELAAGV